MPKETIRCSYPTDDQYRVEVGWQADRDVQVGTETIDHRTLLWTLFGRTSNTDLDSFGKAVRELALSLDEQEAAGKGLSDAGFAEQVLNLLEGYGGAYTGIWTTLDRKACNDAIRVLRKARDQAFGRDE